MVVYFYTHRGKQRTNNEDALLVNGRVFQTEAMDVVQSENFQGGWLVVADGLGGHARGEVASRIVLEILQERNPQDKESLMSTLWEAKDVLLEYARQHPQAYGLGTALAGFLVREEDVLVFNVGDCRVYGYSKGWVRLTKDHTVVEDLIDKGQLTPQEAKNHPRRHILTSALTGDMSDFEIYIRQVDIPVALLACSDGFWEEMEDDLNACGTDVNLIMEVLKEKPQKDNVSFLLLKRNV
ncbi:protein serine/threonine phosphatase [Thermocrinis albus DSM 14484]|uniref:Protein serine/threonine phosphatase n=1 Tax=Thermocrinis albus (strain DSM 14484 / JCM 11386 / HI 11/12) TaxID=638303 RepID=D3SNT8_THEAH|nr:protein phosphatase 2C domain-containing protein [Thermocrinis albus]ADC88825.1 protein serine/threonine phosphatase [Thermocrinis albus DSM 14484]